MDWQGDGGMDRCRHIIAAAVVTLVVTGAVGADLMPVLDAEAVIKGGESVCIPSEVHRTAVAELLLALPSADQFASGVINLPAEPAARERAEESGLPVLADRSNSFDLCLYALIGLGVFRSGHWVRRPSLGFIPEWYHSGGPHQVGHSHAIGPDAFCHATVCFIQTGCVVDQIPQYGLGAIACLCRKSQFTPSALASRGPPSMS